MSFELKEVGAIPTRTASKTQNMSKFTTNGKMNQNRAKLVEEIEKLEQKQQQSLAKKANGQKEEVGFSKLGDLREQLRKLA